VQSDYSDFELADHPLTRARSVRPNGAPKLSRDYLMDPRIPKAPKVPRALGRELAFSLERLPDFRPEEGAKPVPTEPPRRSKKPLALDSVIPAVSMGAGFGILTAMFLLALR
jgi:hypothetical protein